MAMKVDDVQRLAEMLTTRDKEDKDRAPDYADPQRYPRNARVTDVEALTALDTLDKLFTDMRQLMRRAEILESKLTIARAELYDRLEAVHPDVLVVRRGGSGLRDWKGEWWYVGWDHQRYQDENNESRPGDGRGTYI